METGKVNASGCCHCLSWLQHRVPCLDTDNESIARGVRGLHEFLGNAWLLGRVTIVVNLVKEGVRDDGDREMIRKIRYVSLYLTEHVEAYNDNLCLWKGAVEIPARLHWADHVVAKVE